MHVSCATQRDEGFLAAQESGRLEVEVIFGEFTGKGGAAFEEAPPGGLAWKDLVERIQAFTGAKFDAAKKKLQRYDELGLVRKTQSGPWVSKQ
jgi:hypothetical protein